MSAQTDGAATRRGPMGGHGPGHGMMPGEKPKDFKGTLKKMIGFMGRFKAALVVVLVFAIGSTVFNIVGPKVLSTATTELFNGIVAKIDGSGGINFDAIAQILLFTLGLYLLSAACSFVQGWIMSSVSQRTMLRAAPLHRREDRPHAHGLLRAQLGGRHPLAHHQRRGHARPEPEPGRDPAHNVRHHHHRRARHDADHQPAHDARRRGHPAGVGGAHHGGGEALAEVLPGAAAHARRDQRPWWRRRSRATPS